MNREEATRVLREFINTSASGEEKDRLITALVILRDQLPLPGMFDTMKSGPVVKL